LLLISDRNYKSIFAAVEVMLQNFN